MNSIGIVGGGPKVSSHHLDVSEGQLISEITSLDRQIKQTIAKGVVDHVSSGMVYEKQILIAELKLRYPKSNFIKSIEALQKHARH